MEILSQVNNIEIGDHLVLIGFIALAIGILGILLDAILDETWTTILAVTSCTIATIFIVVGFIFKPKGIEYTVRVDNSTTVSNLVDRYEIVSYDKDTDTWLVRNKAP